MLAAGEYLSLPPRSHRQSACLPEPLAQPIAQRTLPTTTSRRPRRRRALPGRASLARLDTACITITTGLQSPAASRDVLQTTSTKVHTTTLCRHAERDSIPPSIYPSLRTGSDLMLQFTRRPPAEIKSRSGSNSSPALPCNSAPADKQSPCHAFREPKPVQRTSVIKPPHHHDRQ